MPLCEQTVRLGCEGAGHGRIVVRINPSRTNPTAEHLPPANAGCADQVMSGWLDTTLAASSRPLNHTGNRDGDNPHSTSARMVPTHPGTMEYR
jgi:hypothetical protein